MYNIIYITEYLLELCGQSNIRYVIRTFQVDQVVYLQWRSVYLLLNTTGHIALGVTHVSRRLSRQWRRRRRRWRPWIYFARSVDIIRGFPSSSSSSSVSSSVSPAIWLLLSRDPVGPTCMTLIRFRWAQRTGSRNPLHSLPREPNPRYFNPSETPPAKLSVGWEMYKRLPRCQVPGGTLTWIRRRTCIYRVFVIVNIVLGIR